MSTSLVFYKWQYCGLWFFAKIPWFLNKYKNTTVEYSLWLGVLWKPAKKLVLCPDCLRAKTEQHKWTSNHHLKDTLHKAAKVVRCSKACKAQGPRQQGPSPLCWNWLYIPICMHLCSEIRHHWNRYFNFLKCVYPETRRVRNVGLMVHRKLK